MSVTNSNRRLFAATAILLTILIVFLLPAQKIAAAEEQPKPLYISEIRLGYGKTAEEAAKSLDGFEILKNGDKYANLNEGSGKDTVVLMGYKTTTEKGKAITDIAAMNMKGGYSFTEYELLMDQYRDSQITPFINRFMKTVKEYRDNYNGDNENNKAKAKYAHDLLNLFEDDDTGMLMGDLLLKTTAEEYGLDKYKELSDEDKKKYGSLTTILMQGETSIVFMVEQLVTMAADTNEDTWLERFEGVTSEDLLKAEMADGKGETDARNDLAKKYEDTARLLSEKWLYFRDSLIRYDEALQAQDGGFEFDPDDAPAAEDEDDDEEEETDKSPEELLEGLSATEAIEAILQYTEDQIETAEAVDDIKIAVSYNYLKNTKYEEGTLYDYFTRFDTAVTQNNYFELYPIVSVLTEGQIAGLDFMNLNQLVQYGVAIGNSYVEMNKQLGQYISSIGVVSVYDGINRELFGSGTALTDAEMRDKAANSTQLFGESQTAAIGRASIYAAIGIASGVASSYCLSRVWGAVKSMQPIKLTSGDMSATTGFLKSVESHRKYLQAVNDNNTEMIEKLASTYIKQVKREYQPDGTVLVKLSVGQQDSSISLIERHYLPGQVGYNESIDVIDNADEIAAKIGYGRQGASSLGRKLGAIFKAGVGTIFSLVFLGLSAYSIYSSALEIYNYYHVDMTKVPKYVVDRADLTETDEKGNTIIVRNDSAYYEAIRSNRDEDADYYDTMSDYGDVNAAEGKQWLVLYVNKDYKVKTPVLADSLKVVTGKSDMPEGYSTGIHMFGESIAVNMTDKTYTYEDDLKGIYVYFRNEPAATTGTGAGTGTQKADGEAPATSSALGAGYLALVGIGCLIGGVFLGVLVMSIAKRKKAKEKDGES